MDATDVTGPSRAFIFHAANVMNAHRGRFAADPTVLSQDDMAMHCSCRTRPKIDVLRETSGRK
jgi:hypothetical protein